MAKSLKDRMNSDIAKVTAASIEFGTLSDELKMDMPKKDEVEVKPVTDKEKPEKPVTRQRKTTTKTSTKEVVEEQPAVVKRGGRPKSKKETRTKRVNFVIQPSLYMAMEEVCERTGRNISNYVAEAVKKALEEDLKN